MANWTTEWITHPDYPGWRKRRLVDPKTGMHALLGTFWERIPGADPTLPGPPGAEGWGGLFPREKWPERKRPDWGKFPIWPEWPPRRKQPPLGSYPGDPEGREPKPYRPPFGTHEMPGIPDGLPKKPRPSWGMFPPGFDKFPRKPPLSPRRPPGWHNLPERVEPDWWRENLPFFPRWKDKDLTPLKPMPMPYNPPGSGSIWDKFPRRKFDGNKEDFFQLLKDAQVGSEMGRTRGLRRENMMIPPGKRKRYPAEFDPATGQNRVVPGTLRTTYPDEERVTGPQLGGVPEGDREFVDTMHNIQNAYFTGADFGYEEGWPEQLGATQEQIDMFMAVPPEAIRHAMENPTDAVLQQFEEYYGFPLNVNDPATQRWVDDFKKRR